MSVFDKLFNDSSPRTKAISDFENEEGDTVGHESVPEENKPVDFLSNIEALAQKHAANQTDSTGQGIIDLSTVSINDYPVTETNDQIIRKIDELNSIIKS